MSKNRCIKSLLKRKGNVYIYLPNQEIAERFMQDAEREGFTFGDGVKPTERQASDIIALYNDMTISYVTTYGRIAFANLSAVEGGLKRVDYEKFISGKKYVF